MAEQTLADLISYRPPEWPELIPQLDPDWILAKWRVPDPKEAAWRLSEALERAVSRWREIGWDNSPYSDPKTWLGDGSTVTRHAFLDPPEWGIGYTDTAVLLRLHIPSPKRTVQQLRSLLPLRYDTVEVEDYEKQDRLLRVVAEVAIPAVHQA